jgi:hypothetical protein
MIIVKSPMRWLCLLLPGLALAAPPQFRVERHAVPGGAELLTIFGHHSDGRQYARGVEIPLLSVLRDTLGDDDPHNDRLRYVWVLTSARPKLLERAVAALPFFYWRASLGSRTPRTPPPLLDLGDTRRHVWSALAGTLTQVMALDPNGALLRSSTRSYRSNASDHRRAHLAEGLSVVSQLENSPVAGDLEPPELLELEARLALAGKPLGGLVDQEHLLEAYFKERTRREETRGRNWELLRQCAEANGLYFLPLGLDPSRTHALLLVAREDLAARRQFDARFLGIANPYTDARLQRWRGLTVVAHFDPDGRWVETPAGGGWSRELIPLALYSLDHPKVPLRLVDFRDTRGPQRQEMLRRAANDAIVGVLGITKWGNWPYLAGSAAWTFVRSRRGDPNNRAARLTSVAQTRRWLALDPELDSRLKQELLARLESASVNPLEESVFQEAGLARRQYHALLRYAADPRGLAERLRADRNAERTAFTHGWKARAGLHAVRVLSFGAYRHREPGEDRLRDAIAGHRRLERAARPQLARQGNTGAGAAE